MSVTIPSVLLGVQIITHVVTTHLLPLLRTVLYDPTMTECLNLVVQLLTVGYHVIFRLPQDYTTDMFDKFVYPHYGGFITILNRKLRQTRSILYHHAFLELDDFLLCPIVSCDLSLKLLLRRHRIRRYQLIHSLSCP